MKKVVLITGGSSGIGKSVGIYLSEKGFTVYGTSRNPANCVNHPFNLVALDVNSEESISKAWLREKLLYNHVLKYWYVQIKHHVFK